MESVALLCMAGKLLQHLKEHLLSVDFSLLNMYRQKEK